MTIDLQERCDLQPGRNRTMSERFGNIDGIRAEFDAFLAYMEYLSVPQADILKVDEASAARMDMVWKTHGWYPGRPQYTKQLNSRVNFLWPDGVWKYRINMIGAHGIDYGQNTSGQKDGDENTYGTELTPDHANWIGLPAFLGRNGKPLRSAFVTATHGQAVGGTYPEGFGVQNIYLNGGAVDRVHDTDFEAYALSITNAGSLSRARDMKMDGWNSGGVNLIGAIPFRIDNVRSFRNNGPSLDLEGTVNGTVWCSAFESDDSRVIVKLSDGRNGSAAGLGMGTFEIKAETGKATGGAQAIMDLKGIYSIAAHVKSAVYNTAKPDAAFILEQQNVNSALRVIQFKCEAGTGSTVGFRNLVRMGNSTQPMPNAAESVEFKVKGGVFLSDAR